MEPAVIPSDPGLDAVRARRLSLRAAMSSLEGALAVPASGRVALWSAGVLAALESLSARMKDHIAATEGPSGFHGEVLAAAPRLSHSVDVSVAEHATIMGLLDALIRDTPLAQTDDAVDSVRECGTSLLGLLSRHRQRGADMIYEAYESDLGGQD
jgi:hypothetical protein